jgi:hypothetical protein
MPKLNRSIFQLAVLTLLKQRSTERQPSCPAPSTTTDQPNPRKGQP